MKNFQLEALRKLLFYTQAEAAAVVGEVVEQTWRRWESGKRTVPDDIAKKMQDLVLWRHIAIETAIDIVDETERKALVWYEKLEDWLSARREAIYWRPQQSVCAEMYSLYPDKVILVQFDPVDYQTWLNGRKDSEPLRQEWASEKMSESDG